MASGLRTSLLILSATGVLAWLGLRQGTFRRLAALADRQPKAVTFVIWLGALVPMIYLAFLVRHYGVNVPMLDDWEMAPLIVKAHTGQLAFADVFGQQQEARTVLPKLIFILSSRDVWDVRDQMMLSVVICWLTTLGIFVLLRRLGLSPAALAVCFWLGVLTIFSIAQYELWIFASGFPTFLAALFVVAALVAIGSRLSTGAKFFLCVALAAASSFTLANGLLAWGLTFPALLIAERVPRWKIWLGLWFVCAALCAIIYFWGYEKPGYLPQFAPGAPLLEYLRFVLIFLGGGLSNSVTENRATVSAAFGLVQLLIFLGALFYALRRIRDRAFVAKVTPWLALGLYSLGSAILAALGRIGFGAEYAAASRYVPFSIYLTIAVIVLTAILCRDLVVSARGRRGIAVIGLVLCLGYLAAYARAQVHSLYFLRRYSAETRLARGAILFSQAFDTLPVIQKIAYPPIPDRAIKVSAALDALGLFRPALLRTNKLNETQHQHADGIKASGSCETLTTDGKHYHASGWAVLNSKRRQADCVVIASQVGDAEPVIFSISDSIAMRWEIARRFPRSDYLWSGWTATLPKSALPPGARLSFWAVDTDQPRLYELTDDSSAKTR